ncbi:Cytochrome P450 9e2 [Eumeta japonica]|uniref:unspecific monooxygenase n=1 Tax=Eumeta variegata TaxID=151549 RepID=A0A4C1UKC6_EUMVA|nr:Cytochrome P450 9e2 [Eumeta japonica]
MYILIWGCALLVVFYLYLRKKHSYFKDHGVNHLPPAPVFGNVTKTILRMEHFVNNLNKLYFAFPEDRFVGNYDFVSPTVMIRDLELLKLIGVKDFDYFTDHRAFTSDNDPVFAKSLFGLKANGTITEINSWNESEHLYRALLKVYAIENAQRCYIPSQSQRIELSGYYRFADDSTGFAILSNILGQKWRNMRSTLSPAFTGSKLRGMVPLIQDCSKNLVRYLKEEIKKHDEGFLDVNTKDLFTRYANDVIATCAFGLKVDSIAEKNNEFYRMGYKLSNFTYVQILKMVAILVFPFVNKITEMQVFPKDVTSFLRQIVLDTMANRDENNKYRPDVIQILLEVKKGILQHENVKDDKDAGFATVEESNIGKSAIKYAWDDDDLVAQAILFFLAGFDTVSTAMVFLMYELAVNEDVQTKLRQEIDTYYEKYQDKIDYDKINEMIYLDMVLSESLRKWPPAPSLDRVSQKEYNLGKPNREATKDFYLEKGAQVVVPVCSIHHDPKYYPDPARFDPERFSDDNKRNIKPFTYMPFGIGPRNCIGGKWAIGIVRESIGYLIEEGANQRNPHSLDSVRHVCIVCSRFALTEVKSMAFDLLRHFEISPASKTRVPAELDPSEAFTMRMLGGHWIRIRLRDNNDLVWNPSNQFFYISSLFQMGQKCFMITPQLFSYGERSENLFHFIPATDLRHYSACCHHHQQRLDGGHSITIRFVYKFMPHVVRLWNDLPLVVEQRLLCKEINFNPSGRLPSERFRLEGSSVHGMLAEISARRMISFRAWRRSKDCERNNFRDSKSFGIALKKIGEPKSLKSSRLGSLRPSTINWNRVKDERALLLQANSSRLSIFTCKHGFHFGIRIRISFVMDSGSLLSVLSFRQYTLREK